MQETSPSTTRESGAAGAEPDNSFEPPQPGDPRFDFAVVVGELRRLVESIDPSDQAALGGPTPCTEFAVRDLLDHIVMVLERVAALGRGEHWSTVEQRQCGPDWSDACVSAAHAVMAAWSDPAKLEAMYEVPWGELPGGPMMYVYTAELAVHGWDLGTATGREFAVDDEFLAGALIAAREVPAEGRDSDEVPFSAVVDPGDDAPTLLRIAGWLGRAI